jgi:PadR family transcriptional regulator PadR
LLNPAPLHTSIREKPVSDGATSKEWRDLENSEMTLLWTVQRSDTLFYVMAKGKVSEQKRSEILQGTLDLMILKTLDAMGPLHGYGIARRIEQLSEDVLHLNEGTVYTSLLRLQQQGWISSNWGASENNRKARFHSISKAGRRQLAEETENWQRISGVIGKILQAASAK